MRELNRHGAEQTYLLAGTGTTEFSNHSHASYNTAMLLSPQGKTIYRYYKNHLVMFGEYIPIIDWFPWIYQYTPMPGGLKPGRAPGTFSLHQTPFSTSVCFESTVPHVIRRQALASKPAIVHLNLSNDGWFYGSSILDLHFQSAVLRAVENRLPVLVAANTGISAVIDRAGRVEQRGPRHATALISTSVERTTQTSFYATVLGDWLAFLCCWVNIIFGLWPCWKSYRTPRQSPSGSS
jgi:apolipoprotein N-acyltransferase